MWNANFTNIATSTLILEIIYKHNRNLRLAGVQIRAKLLGQGQYSRIFINVVLPQLLLKMEKKKTEYPETKKTLIF